MELQDLQDVFATLMCAGVLPAILVLTTYSVKAMKVWITEKLQLLDNEVASEYLHYITEVIGQAVMYTTQTYVDALKKEDSFDLEAQKAAFDKTKDAVLTLLAEDAKEFIAKTYGDMDRWLDTKIEQLVKENKSEPKKLKP